MGHAFSWGELGHLFLNLPQASWLLRMTALLGVEKHPARRAENTTEAQWRTTVLPPAIECRGRHSPLPRQEIRGSRGICSSLYQQPIHRGANHGYSLTPRC